MVDFDTILKMEKLIWFQKKLTLSTMLGITGVTSRSKMYRTSADSAGHAVLHVAQKNRLYIVHFDFKTVKVIYSIKGDF